MKLLLLLTLLAVAFARFSILSAQLSDVSAQDGKGDTKYVSLAQWFTQRTDHFNDRDKRTWQQKFYMNQKFWDGKGCIILYIGGEGPLNNPPGDKSFVGTLAKEHNCLIVALEHRFYGESIPTLGQPKALSAKNLELLNSRQALADLAHFINSFKTNVTETTGNKHKVISVGGSYPGALSAWLRVRYPHLIDAAISSSGVVNSIVDFHAFDTAITEALGTVCSSQLRKVTHLFEEKMKTAKGKKECYDVFGMDKDYRSDDFWWLLADSQIIPTQYSQKPRLCKILGNLEGQALFDAYKYYAREIFMKEYEPHGLCEYDSRCLANEEYVPGLSARQWYWQSCLELGWLQTAPAKDSIRSTQMDLDFFTKYCQRSYFGGKNVPIVDDGTFINAQYGGDLPRATNVIYVNHADDPWSVTSVRDHKKDTHDDIGETNYRFFSTCELNEGCGHCFELHQDEPNDPPSIREVREKIRVVVRKWLL
ncbi:hypothetical protein RCL1_005784 [Eukaryota sp. TZLM3-RCL]